MKYVLAANLVNELVEATDKRQLSKTIARYGRVDLLCVDELGYMETRRARRRTAVSGPDRARGGQLGAIASDGSFSGWTKTFTDPRLCAAIVDRLTSGHREHGPAVVPRPRGDPGPTDPRGAIETVDEQPRAAAGNEDRAEDVDDQDAEQQKTGQHRQQLQRRSFVVLKRSASKSLQQALVLPVHRSVGHALSDLVVGGCRAAGWRGWRTGRWVTWRCSFLRCWSSACCMRAPYRLLSGAADIPCRKMLSRMVQPATVNTSSAAGTPGVAMTSTA